MLDKSLNLFTDFYSSNISFRYTNKSRIVLLSVHILFRE
jgi:hypothetical protein